MKKPDRIVSAPGRVCLFGEHCDYLGLPVITMAINKRLKISAFARRDKKFRIMMPDIKEEETFVPSKTLRYGKKRDYLKAAVNVLKREGFKFPKGYDFIIRSQIPITAGTSSSSAMVVAWVRMLLSFQQDYRQFSPIDIAQWAFQTEVSEFNEPGGRMDHFAIALGGFIYQENRRTLDIHYFRHPLSGMVLGDSCQQKETLRDLKRNRLDVMSGFKQIKKKIKKFHVERTLLKDIQKKLKPNSDPLKKAMATLKNRDLCKMALETYSQRPSNFEKKIGRLMDQHHSQLRAFLKISTPKIEEMIQAAKRAGALGAKINGSGLGGTMIAYAPGKEEKVAKAIERAGGKAWVVKQDLGVV